MVFILFLRLGMLLITLVTGTICAAESGIRQIHSELLLHRVYKIHFYLQFPGLSTPFSGHLAAIDCSYCA